MLEKSQQLDGLVQHGANAGRLLSCGNPGKAGEVEMGTIGGAGTCCRKAQDGAAKIEGWGGAHRAGGKEQEKGQQKPLPCKADFIHHASADGRGVMNTLIYGLRLADTRLKEKGANLTFRYTSVKLNPEQLPWLPVQRWCQWSGTPAGSGAVLRPPEPCKEQEILHSLHGGISYTLFHIIFIRTESYMILDDVLNESTRAAYLQTATATQCWDPP